MSDPDQRNRVTPNDDGVFMPIPGDENGEPTSDALGNQHGRRRSAFRDILETAILALVIFVLVRTVVLNFKVDGSSMMPTFETGEMLLVNRNAYRALDAWDFVDWIPGVDERNTTPIIDFGEPGRGDVIVFTPPEPGKQSPYIKRVIGVPGDQVQVRDDGVFINDTRLEEDYISSDGYRCDADWDYCGDVTVTVPENSVYVMGDNRTNSEDSRFFGMVPENQIIGKAWVVYWPSEMWGPVSAEPYPELRP